MSFAPSLETLFFMLRSAGIPVGIQEIARLQEVFALEPALDGDGLRRVLQSTLIKSLDEQPLFERIYRNWLAAVEQRLMTVQPALAAPHAERAKLARKRMTRDEKPADAPAPAGQAEAAIRAGLSATRLVTAERRGPVSDEADDTWLGAGSATEVRMAPAGAPAGHADAAGPEVDGAPLPSTQGARPRARSLAFSSLVVVLAIVGAVLGLRQLGSGTREIRQQIHDAGAIPDAGQEYSRDAGPSISPYQRAMMQVALADIQIVSRPPPETSVLGFALAAFALGLMIWLWARFGRGTWLPAEPAAEADQEQALVAAPARRSLETLTLDEHDEEELVWGVGRFMSQDGGRDLDVESTVRETASAYGRPVLVYQGHLHQREVWLWIDESVDTPVVRQLADDLALMLEKSGLPVMRATFWGMPDRLRTSGEEVITVDAFDARRESAAVAILTDGRMMSLAHRARNRRGDVHELLRNLAYWPRVTFIDFGDGRLEPLCERHGLRVIKPADAAGAISEFTDRYERPAESDVLVGDARVWAAACSLSPYPVPEREALALRRELALDVSPWAVQRIHGQARGAAEGIDLAVEERARLLAWLMEAEEPSAMRGSRPVRRNLLARVVEAWDRVLERRRDTLARAAYPSGRAGLGDAGAGQFEWQYELQRAYIHLWTDPEHAVAVLYRMHRSGAAKERTEIERCLGHLGTREDMGTDGVVALPWSLVELGRESRVMLGELGFGRGRRARALHSSMPAPGRVWLSVGLCLGVMAGAVGALAQQFWIAERPEPVFIEQGQRPHNAYVQSMKRDHHTWRAVAGTPWTQAHIEELERGDQATLTWQSLSLPCVERRGPVTIYRCRPDGTAPAGTSEDRGFWSFAIISGDLRQQAEKVTEELLASGSVDGVYLIDSPEALAELPMASLARPRARQPADRWDQLLIVADASLENLDQYSGRSVLVEVDQIGSLIGVTDDYEGWSSLAAQRPGLLVKSGRAGDFRVRGMGPCGAEGQRCCVVPLESCQGDLRCAGETCVAVECRLSDPDRCVDASTLEVCTDEGMWRRSSCAVTEICDARLGACRRKTCDDIQCGPSERCDAETAVCIPRTCQGSQSRCHAKGTEFRVCDADSGEWGRARRCLAGSLCTDRSPCQPIRYATIELVRAEYVSDDERADERRYRVRCTANSSRRRIVREFDLATSAGKQPLALGSFQLPYGESRRHIRLSCEAHDLQRGDEQSSIRAGQKGVMTGSATHDWDLGANGTHEVGLSGSASASALRVTYKISLSLGFDDVRPFEGSQP